MLPEPASLALFMTAGLVLLVVPGPAVLYVVARSVDQGRAAGFVSVLGISLGAMVHVSAAAFGLSALLVRSAVAFSTVKYLGAAYLVFLGVQRLRASTVVDARSHPQSAPLNTIFRQGVWVNVLNPKTALFFFAFLPQFVEPDRGSAAAQVFLLGTIFVTMGILSDGLYALAAGSMGEWLRRRPAVLTGQRFVAGGMLIALGAATAFTGSRAR